MSKQPDQIGIFFDQMPHGPHDLSQKEFPMTPMLTSAPAVISRPTFVIA